MFNLLKLFQCFEITLRVGIIWVGISAFVQMAIGDAEVGDAHEVVTQEDIMLDV